MTEFYATQTVNNMNETMEFCSKCMEVSEMYTYRADTQIQAWRNEGLHSLMHNRSHQLEY